MVIYFNLLDILREVMMDYLLEIKNKDLNNKPKLKIPFLKCNLDKYKDGIGKLINFNGNDYKVTEVDEGGIIERRGETYCYSPLITAERVI